MKRSTLSADIARAVDPIVADMDDFLGVALTEDRSTAFDAAYDLAVALAPYLGAFATVYRVMLSGANDRIYAYCASSSRALTFRDASFRRGKRYASYDVTAVDAIATVSVPSR